MNTTDLASKGAFWDVTRWRPKNNDDDDDYDDDNKCNSNNSNSNNCNNNKLIKRCVLV